MHSVRRLLKKPFEVELVPQVLPERKLDRMKTTSRADHHGNSFAWSTSQPR